MKVILTVASLCLLTACTMSTSQTTSTDSTDVAPDTSLVLEAQSESPQPERTPLNGELGDDLAYEIKDGYSVVSAPFDFNLSADYLKMILGDSTEITEEEFEGGEDYGPFSYYTVVNGENEFKFYSYEGKHYANVVSPLIGFVNDVKIGCTKAYFLKQMNLTDSAALKAESITYSDVFGGITYYFDADTLRRVFVSYEEGD